MTLHEYLSKSEQVCREYFDSLSLDLIRPEELRIGTVEYFLRGGKRLRPAILMLCAGAVGGKQAEAAVIPSACAVEFFHTFTLIHDDIIDNDPTRRGGKSVHILVSDKFSTSGASAEKCDEYGRDTAILSGDMLHALSTIAMLDTAKNPLFSPSTVISVTKMLEYECLSGVLEGEALDTRAGLIKDESAPFSTGTFEESLEIMLKKTGVLFAFAAKAGAMLGLNTSDDSHPYIVALGKFASLCGIAFQLQDDVLGIVADEKTLGKPIGSDIREGKRTVILQKAYESASAQQKTIIEKTVGNQSATDAEIELVKNIFISTGAIEHTKSLAGEYISKALLQLEILPDSEYLDILKQWARFMSERDL
jgi:geranylgeranyl diphosphate synthase type I